MTAANQLRRSNARDGRLCSVRRLLGALTAGALLILASASAASAETVTFGSSLKVAATMNTDELDYKGTETSYEGKEVRTDHDGADTALWNVEAPAGEAPAAPAAGEIKSVKLEGCAERPEGAAPPLTQIHFQDLHPTGGGAVQVVATSAPFEIPVCGENGASDKTVTTYTPEALCVLPGDYVDLNDEGGEAASYRGGVPYEVIGSVAGATMDSFIANNETNNGDALSPSRTEAMAGFASNSKQELMLQATEFEGNTYYCHGAPEAPAEKPAGGSKTEGSKGPGGTTKKAAAKAVPSVLKLLKQDEQVKKDKVGVSLSCIGKAACTGTLVLKAKALSGGVEEIGHRALSLAGGHKQVVTVELTALGRKRMHEADGARVKTTVTLRAASGEPTAVGTLLLK